MCAERLWLPVRCFCELFISLVFTDSFWPLFLSQADLNCNIQDDSGSFYGVTSQYESSENMTITCSTKVCSFGKQVVEKVEVWTCISYLCIITLTESCVSLHTFNIF